MKDYLTRFTEDSEQYQKVVRKSLPHEPSKPTKGVFEIGLIFGKLPDGEPSKPAEPAFEGFEGEEIELFSNIAPEHATVCHDENQGKHPYLTEDNELIIPLFTPIYYRWWQGGQSVWATLAELNAPLSRWRGRAANREDFLLSPNHSESCGGDVKPGGGFLFVSNVAATQ